MTSSGAASSVGDRRDVAIDYDGDGVPTVSSATRAGVAFGLGYAVGGDRFFQMDLWRRRSAGRLSELFGPATVAGDIRQRVLGFESRAGEILERLQNGQRALVDAFADGVNARLENEPPSWEYELLAAQARPWDAASSVLVALLMTQMLSLDGEEKRMLTVMHECVPLDVREFLLPLTGPYSTSIVGQSIDPGDAAFPLASLAALIRAAPASRGDACVVGRVPWGSNAWAVAGSRTRHGAAILANDMHLDLAVPNVWYRARLEYGDVAASGVTMPGIPLVVAGSNGRVAWGMTRLPANTMDLVEVEVHADGRCRGPGGWTETHLRVEDVAVRGGEAQRIEVVETPWGPVTGRSPGGRALAFRWAPLEPGGLDFGLADLAEARDVESLCDAANGAAGPPLNVVAAGADGRVSWTVCGRFPDRPPESPALVVSLDGSVETWDRCLGPEELPRVVDPPTGMVVAANNLAPEHGAHGRIAFNCFSGRRARRVAEVVGVRDDLTEDDVFSLQHDTDAAFYRFYADLVLDVTAGRSGPPALLRARAGVEAWDGRADTSSRGLPLLVAFREGVRESLFAALLHACTSKDPSFAYVWHDHELPLRALLESRDDRLAPPPHATFDDFVRAEVEMAQLGLESIHGAERPVSWGDVNPATIMHALSALDPALAARLDRPDVPLPGCDESVCVARPAFGASIRLVVAPGDESDGRVSVPGGQTSDPADPRYHAAFERWLDATPSPVVPGSPVRRVVRELREPAGKGLHG